MHRHRGAGTTQVSAGVECRLSIRSERSIGAIGRSPGRYSAAARLRSVVMAMWNADAYKVGLGKLLSLNWHHFDAYMKMFAHYHRHGENDPAFMRLADEVRQGMEQEEAAAAHDQALETWGKQVRAALRDLGLRPRLFDDRYDWFEAEFNAGSTPTAAAAKAKSL